MKYGGYSQEGPPRELADRIAKLLSGGCTRADACAVVGISPRSLRAWMRKGQFLSGDRNHRYCYEVVATAEAKCKAHMISKVVSSNDWKAAAHWLKCRFPDEYGDRRTLEVEDKRVAAMDRRQLLAELRDQMALLEESIEAEGHTVPRLGEEILPAPAPFPLAEEGGAFVAEQDPELATMIGDLDSPLGGREASSEDDPAKRRGDHDSVYERSKHLPPSKRFVGL